MSQTLRRRDRLGQPSSSVARCCSPPPETRLPEGKAWASGWLDPRSADMRCGSRLTRRPVSPRLNCTGVGNNDPTITAPLTASVTSQLYRESCRSGILMSASFDSFPERYTFRLHSKCCQVSVPAAYRTMGVLKFDRQSDFLVAVERAYWRLSGLMFVGHICHAAATPSPSPAIGHEAKSPFCRTTIPDDRQPRFHARAPGMPEGSRAACRTA